MRQARIRFGEGMGGTYLAMSRFAGGAHVFDVSNGACPRARYFLELMRKLEAFHGMTIVTYTLMSTHFHLLVREPIQRLTSIPDEDLIKKSGYSTALRLLVNCAGSSIICAPS